MGQPSFSGIAVPSSGTVTAFGEELFEKMYPFMFSLTRDMHLLLADRRAEEDTKGIMSIINHITTEFDEYCTKEESVLFPFLEKLEAEHGKSESCKPFKDVKVHYTTLLSLLVSLKDCSEDLQDREAITGLLNLVTRFEQSLISVQISKDKNLYSRFKNCSNGCGRL